ncbi:X-linked retinitis pigmentosa GTPase regulator-interacting protein 1 isoform X2 [Sarcophilus harrisii]|nr:X-linked retinitis pigmentosa GTPase regulator-interacting protein 1 isoform X2 [Sarcophilus harrisii]
MLRTSHNALLSQVDELKTELKEKNKRVVSLESQLADMSVLRITVREFQDRVEDLKRERNLLKGNHDRLLKNMLNSSNQPHWSTDLMKERLQQKVSHLQEQLDSEVAEKRKILVQLAKEQAENADLKQEVTQMLMKHKKEVELLQQKTATTTTTSSQSDPDILQPSYQDYTKETQTQELNPPQEIKEEEKNLSWAYNQMKAAHAETALELEKTRDMLLLQHQINKHYQDELEIVKIKADNSEKEHKEEWEKLNQLLDLKNNRIQQLEAQLKDVAYGTLKFPLHLEIPVHEENMIDCLQLHQGNNGEDFGTLDYWMRLKFPIAHSLQAYNKRLKAQTYLSANVLGARKAQPKEGRSEIFKHRNQLWVEIIRCCNLRSRRLGAQPSPYAMYQFFTFSDHDTPIIPASNHPHFGDQASFSVHMTLELDQYLRQMVLPIYVFDDNDLELGWFLGKAQVPLLPLAQDKVIKGNFNLSDPMGKPNGSIEVKLEWESQYLSPEGSEKPETTQSVEKDKKAPLSVENHKEAPLFVEKHEANLRVEDYNEALPSGENEADLRLEREHEAPLSVEKYEAPLFKENCETPPRPTETYEANLSVEDYNEADLSVEIYNEANLRVEDYEENLPIEKYHINPSLEKREIKMSKENADEAKMSIEDYEEAKPPIGNCDEAKPPIGNCDEAKPPIGNYDEAKPPIGNCDEAKPPIGNYDEAKPPIGNCDEAKPPIGNCDEEKSPIGNYDEAKSPNCDEAKSPIGNCDEAKPPIGNCNKEKQSIEVCHEFKPSIENCEETKLSLEDYDEAKLAIENYNEEKERVENCKEAKLSLENCDEEEQSLANCEEAKLSLEDYDEAKLAIENCDEENKSLENCDKAKLSLENCDEVEQFIENCDEAKLSLENCDKATENGEEAKLSLENCDKATENGEEAKLSLENCDEEEQSIEICDEEKQSLENSDKAKLSLENCDEEEQSIENCGEAKLRLENFEDDNLSIENSDEAKLPIENRDEEKDSIENDKEMPLLVEDYNKAPEPIENYNEKLIKIPTEEENILFHQMNEDKLSGAIDEATKEPEECYPEVKQQVFSSPDTATNRLSEQADEVSETQTADSDDVIVTPLSQKGPKTNSDKICIEIVSLAFDPEAEVMSDESIQQVYVEYKFHDLPLSETETPVSLRKPRAGEDIHFHFNKVIDLNPVEHRDRRKFLFSMLQEKNPEQRQLKFIVVSDPEEQKNECQEVGYAYLELWQILDTGRDILEQEIDIINPQDKVSSIGKLKVSLQATDALQAIFKEMGENMHL